ncbi:hypothetical protein PUN28_003867 [Cardiocondyla obscurior]|uniref:Uncharacterized protein n=1 Tax=Cardiocondyla obscurior TaxID=286306 RepID=A0AAW2GMD2_9HYME
MTERSELPRGARTRWAPPRCASPSSLPRLISRVHLRVHLFVLLYFSFEHGNAHLRPLILTARNNDNNGESRGTRRTHSHGSRASPHASYPPRRSTMPGKRDSDGFYRSGNKYREESRSSVDRSGQRGALSRSGDLGDKSATTRSSPFFVSLEGFDSTFFFSFFFFYRSLKQLIGRDVIDFQIPIIVI